MTGKINRNAFQAVTNKNSSYSRVISVPLPQCADEIRFRLFSPTIGTFVSYSFNPYFEGLVDCPTAGKLPADIVNWVPFCNENDESLFGVISTYTHNYLASEEFVIRKPSSLGKNIYFFCSMLADDGETWAVQYTIIGGENKNGY